MRAIRASKRRLACSQPVAMPDASAPEYRILREQARRKSWILETVSRKTQKRASGVLPLSRPARLATPNSRASAFVTASARRSRSASSKLDDKLLDGHFASRIERRVAARQ